MKVLSREAFGRDGMFNDNDLFLVFEKDDLIELRGKIDEAIVGVPRDGNYDDA